MTSVQLQIAAVKATAPMIQPGTPETNITMSEATSG